MKRHSVSVRLFFLMTFVCATALSAQNQAPPPDAAERVDSQMMTKIREEGLQRSQVMDLASLMTDVYGPRLTNSPITRRACDWAVKKMEEMGLQNAHLEAWGPFGRGWTLEGFSLNIVAPHFSQLIGVPKAWSSSTKGPVRGKPIFLDVKTDADLEKYKGKLKGAIVLMSAPIEVKAHFEPKGERLTDQELLAMANADPPGGGFGGPGGPGGPGRRRFGMGQDFSMVNKKWQLCYQEGAAVVIEGSRGDGGLLFVQSATLVDAPDTPFDQRRRVYAKDAPPAIPQVVLSADYYNRVIRMIQKGSDVELEVNLNCKFHEDDLMSHNVIAEIPGTDLKDEIVMLGAHYDSWHGGTGATDNAAGSAVCMEAMRILQALGVKPRRTIRVALWTGEEQGLLGSRAYVEKHFGSRNTQRTAAAPAGAAAQAAPALEITPSHEKFSAYFNLDNGTGKIRGVHMQGNDAVRPIFRAWLAPFRDLGASTLTISNTGGTDHQSFDGVGLPGFQFIQDPVEYDTRTHHTNIDVHDRLQADDLKQASVIMAAFVYNAAMRDGKLPRKPMRGEVRVRTQ